ncbi:rab3 GTPase-activating protein catalytic subunit isoform X4 [Vigna radiata var. radiata]|uniref:Rab3 GTPase-activating protein catalytic subunit n=1 Tax=Vigna radiata var. radiata TaxID=3916 RepID=A0A1S3T7W4_VIGRR|nr:rab3 GTPase-activating protein catalytic subunit isoform X4 [Vigna radiata var. radiata]
MASFSISTKVEPDADDDCVAEEEVFHFSYLFHSLVIHWFLSLQCHYRIRANANLLALLALQFENFDDFTIASPWERFIYEIEAVCRDWMTDSPKRLLDKGAVALVYSNYSYKVNSELKYGTESYCMEYYFETNNNGQPGTADWRSGFHDLQLCFGVKEFLVISPKSVSSTVLDAPEASKLLSAVAIALSNCSSLWAAFVPVHDPSRKAYIGIQNMGTVFTRRFEADGICSQVPRRLMHLEGLYELFVSKFVHSTLDLPTNFFKVQFAMMLTYKMLAHDDYNMKAIDAQNTNSGENLTGETSNETLWDNDCPWSEWYSAEDPVKGFELITIWSKKMVESSLEMAELENASPYEAEKWLICPICAPKLPEVSEWNQIGFASQLHILVDALKMSFKAQFMENFVSDDNSGSENLNSSMVILPPTVSDQVLKELFQEGVQVTYSAYGGNKTSGAIKGAPLESLFAQFCLHSLWFGYCNIRAIAVLWIEFVREVRRCWEESQLIPRMPANGPIDLSTCLINQKLQMLAVCIEKKCEVNEDYQDCIGSEDQIESMTEEESVVGDDSFKMRISCGDFSGNVDSFPTAGDIHYSVKTVSAFSGKHSDGDDKKPSDITRRGSASIADAMMLLKSNESMHAPYTQEAPLMTEDMHEECPQDVEDFSDSFNFSTLVERDTLASDMSAFKAANPKAVFEDFIRWHSPGDWIDDDDLEVEMSKDNSSPRGKLSKRMSKNGNSWRNIWSRSPALPFSEQKPLIDPNREGEKVIHYLETLQPHQLLEQMLCTAFGAAADTLIQTNYGELKQMETMMQHLYLTLPPALKPLQENRLSVDSETIEDLRRLCVVFQHVEKLLTLAASLHRKFLQAPRLAREIFSDFYNFYIPRMGIGLIEEKEFDKKQAVWNEEREVVANMLVQPTANQSWRKVLSMGNLLNGHEPIQREIIFSLHGVNGNHYAIPTATVSLQNIETYRMYICGTSNDLRVALSVVSSD